MNADRGPEGRADELLRARDTARLAVPAPPHNQPLDLDTAYRVGRVLHDRLEERGFRPVGRKIGLTNPATWDQFRVCEPIWAHVYDRTVHVAPGGRLRLSLDGMVAPRLEAEVVLRLRQPVPGGELSPEDLVGCVEWAAIGFEVVDSHYPGWRFTAAEAVADFGVHAALVVGRPWQVEGVAHGEVAVALKALRATLRRGHEVAAAGEGRNTLGSPLLALGLLARVLAKQPWAPPLRAGEIIATGTLTPLVELTRGESYRVEINGPPLGALELRVES